MLESRDRIFAEHPCFPLISPLSTAIMQGEKERSSIVRWNSTLEWSMKGHEGTPTDWLIRWWFTFYGGKSPSSHMSFVWFSNHRGQANPSYMIVDGRNPAPAGMYKDHVKNVFSLPCKSQGIQGWILVHAIFTDEMFSTASARRRRLMRSAIFSEDWGRGGRWSMGLFPWLVFFCPQ